MFPSETGALVLVHPLVIVEKKHEFLSCVSARRSAVMFMCLFPFGPQAKSPTVGPNVCDCQNTVLINSQSVSKLTQ